MQMPPSIFAQASFWLEPAASTSAQRHDPVFYTVLWVTVFFFALVVALMLLFVVLYRRRKGEPQREGPTHNTPLEVIWTGVPLATVIGLFVIGLHAFVDFDTPLADATVVRRRAPAVAFTFTYPNGAARRQAVPGARPAGHSATQLGRRAARALTSRPFACSATRMCPAAPPRCGRRPARLGYVPYLLHAILRRRPRARCTTECDWSRHGGLLRPSCAELANIFVDRADAASRCPRPRWARRSTRSAAADNATRSTVRPASGPTWKGLFKRDRGLLRSPPPGYTLAAGRRATPNGTRIVRESVLDPGRPSSKAIRT